MESGNGVIAAVVALHFPRARDLGRLLQNLADQVDLVVLVDNTPRPLAEIANLAALFSSRVSYLPLMDNVGIAAAQNTGIEHATAEGASHIILFDQDSAPAPGMVIALLSAEASLSDEGFPVAAVGPVFVDERTRKAYPVVRYSFLGLRTITVESARSKPIEAHFLIASGCLMRTSTLRVVGKMREELFIDWVDNEWGLRARSMGLRCYVIPQARMTHNVGNGSIRLFWRRIHLHEDARNYYLLRNAIYLMRVNTMGIRWKLSFLPRLPFYIVLYPMLSKSKKDNLRLVVKAILDGLCGRMGRLESAEGQL